MKSGRYRLLVSLVACLTACSETAPWPDWTAEREAFVEPTQDLTQEKLGALWSELVTSVHTVTALDVPPLLGDAVEMPFSVGAGDNIGNDDIDYRTEKASLDCPQGGSATFERMADDLLEDRMHATYDGCRYNIIVGPVVVPQQLTGEAWIDVQTSGWTYFRFDGEMFVQGHARELVLEMAWLSDGLRLSLGSAGNTVLADLDLPGTGLSGTVVLHAGDDSYECQTDQETIYCVGLESGASLQVPLDDAG